MRFPPIEERIAARAVLNPATGCIEWTGPTNAGGYGTTWFQGRKQPLHRIVWHLANGPAPSGMHVMHACDNRRCCNLDHLSLGSPGDNARDMAAKGRWSNQYVGRPSCPEGHPYTPENTYLRRGHVRICRTCKNEKARRYRAGKAAA